jgi:hypothetical protein
MDRILALVIFLVLPFSTQAASTVVYPNFTGLTSTTVGGVKTAAAASAATITNGVAKFPGSPNLFLGTMPEVSKAFSASAPVVPSLTRQLAATGLRTLGGATVFGLALWALEKGLSQDGEGKWIKSVPAPVYQNVDTQCSAFNESTGSTSPYWNDYCRPNAPYGGGAGCKIVHNASTNICGLYTIGSNSHLANLGNGTQPQTNSQPATQADFDDLANTGRNLSDAEIEELRQAWGMAYPIPVSAPNTVIGDFSHLTAQEIADLQSLGFFQPTPTSGAVPNGDSYTDPLSGEKRQPYLQFDPAPNGGVRVTPYDQVLNPDGTPKQDVNNNPINVPSESNDPCAIDPGRAGCAPLGSLDEAAPGPTQTPVSITPQAAWGNAGQCPQDVVLNVMGQSVPFKFSGACQFFQLMNPVVLAAAWVSALFIFIGGVRTES